MTSFQQCTPLSKTGNKSTMDAVNETRPSVPPTIMTIHVTARDTRLASGCRRSQKNDGRIHDVKVDAVLPVSEKTTSTVGTTTAMRKETTVMDVASKM